MTIETMRRGGAWGMWEDALPLALIIAAGVITMFALALKDDDDEDTDA